MSWSWHLIVIDRSRCLVTNQSRRHLRFLEMHERPHFVDFGPHLWAVRRRLEDRRRLAAAFRALRLRCAGVRERRLGVFRFDFVFFRFGFPRLGVFARNRDGSSPQPIFWCWVQHPSAETATREHRAFHWVMLLHLPSGRLSMLPP